MNTEQDLTIAILSHLFANFGVLDFRLVSIKHLDFCTKHLIEFYDERDREEASIMYACQTVVNGATLKLAYVEFSCNHFDFTDTDLILLVAMEGCPIYGCYLSIDDRHEPSDGFIACKFKDTWMPSSIDIQGTFLAGMERLKDLTAKYEKCKDYQSLYEDLKAFIKYHEVFQEVQEAGPNED